MVARRAGIDEKLDAEMLELHGAVRGSDGSSKGTQRGSCRAATVSRNVASE